MCGISGIASLKNTKVPDLRRKVEVMNHLMRHRGPDGEGIWSSPNDGVGFGHKRLSIIDLEAGQQPMTGEAGLTICFNGEIYNYLELKSELSEYPFRTNSDTEIALAAYLKWGRECLNHFRGMFAMAIWDERERRLFCARDQFGIKPFYYTADSENFYFASEVKSLLPFLNEIKMDPMALKEYLVFQLYLSDQTLFKDVRQLGAGHYLVIENGKMEVCRYWDVQYNLDFEHTPKFFEEKLRHLLQESVELHTRSDVPIGAYISGGIDSGLIAGLAKGKKPDLLAFTGKFSREGASFDESGYARDIAQMHDIELLEQDITADDFARDISKVIYHLDYPVAGPGAFAQFAVSGLAAKHRKVVLGGQGGDEIFGGYTRYLIAYFEQCIKAAIDGTLRNGNFVVTYESIIGNLGALSAYKPLIQEFFAAGLFGPLDQRYYRLINRAPHLGDEVRWDLMSDCNPMDRFMEIFNGKNVGKESYFDKMTHFDFKTLLPALLQVEDRMSMAWGVESRVPLIDRRIVEFAATMPADVKFKDGSLKMVLVNAAKSQLPKSVFERKSKMGFPVPINEWMQGDLKTFIRDVFSTRKALGREFVDNGKVIGKMDSESKFGRTLWGLLSLELWSQQFMDREAEFKKLVQ